MLVGNIKGESKFVEAIILFLHKFGKSPQPILSPYEHIKGSKTIKNRKGFEKWHYNQAVKRLRATEHVQIVERNGKLFIELTKKGKLKSLLAKLGPNSAKKWDGKWRLIIWDIPESSRKQRDAVRWFVKKLGFYQLQKSVFLTPFELSGEAVEYLIESGLWKFIRFLRVDRLDDDREIKNHFGL